MRYYPKIGPSGGGGGDDELVKISANDTTAGFLNGKLVAGTGIDLTELNNGSNESLEVALNSATQSSLSLADTSIQPGDNVSDLTNDAGYALLDGSNTPFTGDIEVPYEAIGGSWFTSNEVPTKKSVIEAINSIVFIESDPQFNGWLSTDPLGPYALLDGSNHPFTLVNTPIIKPNSNSTSAIRITKADGTTLVANFDTTNSRVGILTNTPESILHLETNANSAERITLRNSNAGTSARAGIGLFNGTLGGNSAALNLNGSGYTGVAGWANRFTVQTASLVSNGIIFYAVAGGIQLSTSGTNIPDLFVEPTTGNVGIGIAAPTAKLHAISSAYPVTRTERTTTTTTGLFGAFDLQGTTSGNMLDTFGVTQSFSIRDNANVTNVIGTVGFYRSGADNSGTYRIQTYKTGTPTTRLEIDPDGIFNNGGSGNTMSFRTNILYNTGTEVKIFRAQSTDNTVNSVASNSSYVNNAGISILAHASARTLTRFGLTLGGYAELLTTTGDSGNPNGMIIGSDLNIPIIFGTNNLQRFRIHQNGYLIAYAMPTASAGLPTGAIWSDGGTLKIV